jgi:hypothetical protein
MLLPAWRVFLDACIFTDGCGKTAGQLSTWRVWSCPVLAYAIGFDSTGNPFVADGGNQRMI